ncbi:hypothetical protein B296_00021480 [Ensete ventricosum]|uniref:SOUL heme-binding protein n=1 Tax=Ensete ventricosum TaxID=4639 RepID=A0A426ZEL7_ENSVE|nr:hypothetical protein B296_00021480 [Ensete ventricosum]
MGLILGKISVETPKYEVIHACPDYEIRKYSPRVVAEVTYDPSMLRGDPDGGFMILANYIGAVGKPQNVRPEKIAMTAPVINKAGPEKIAMTAPVITNGGGEGKVVTMQFVLPSKYSRAEEAPAPVDERVVVRVEGEAKFGVVRFSGLTTDKAVAERVEQLRRCLERDGHKVVGDFLLARYNPPWTLPFLRTNEVMLPIES